MSGRNLIDLCISTGLQIADGRCGMDKLGIGRFTCHTANGSIVLWTMYWLTQVYCASWKTLIWEITAIFRSFPYYINFSLALSRGSVKLGGIKAKAEALLEEKLL